MRAAHPGAGQRHGEGAGLRVSLRVHAAEGENDEWTDMHDRMAWEADEEGLHELAEQFRSAGESKSTMRSVTASYCCSLQSFGFGLRPDGKAPALYFWIAMSKLSRLIFMKPKKPY